MQLMSNMSSTDVEAVESDDSFTVETVVPVTIGILATVFAGALIALVVVCRRRYCKSPDYLTMQYTEYQPDNALLDKDEHCFLSANSQGVELDDVRVANIDLETLLNDQVWVTDVTGVAPHCLAILKAVHQLTERLVSVTLRTTQCSAATGQGQFEGFVGGQLPPETLTQLVSVVKRIGPRVDQVVQAMYPPMDVRLLEARCSALVLSVNHLVLLTKNICRLSVTLDWVDQLLADVEDNLTVLRSYSAAYEMTFKPTTTFDYHVHIHSQSTPPNAELNSRTTDGQVIIANE